MYVDPILPRLVAVLLIILLVAFGLRALRQPHVVGYLVAGVVIGPDLTAVVTDQELIGNIGSIGVVLLMFFIGMEVSPRRLAQGWRIALFGTFLQIAISVGTVLALGSLLDWPLRRCVVLGFVISMSSTAVVLKLLRDWRELDSHVGRNVVGITLMQDLAVIPMLAVIGLMGGSRTESASWVLQLLGGAAMVALCVWLSRAAHVRLPFARALRIDHELQVFAASAIALGLALISGLMGLSTALGAFVAGMLVSSARETEWVYHRLEPFRVVFVALFFVSVGMLIDLDFLAAHWWKALLLVLAVLLTNNFINSFTLRLLGDSWRDALYAGALLAQIGEFSFLMASVAFHYGLIGTFGYQMTMAVIALSLVASPAWIAGMRWAVGHPSPARARR